MMKFKSLFRRGHGSPSSSGTKHRGDRNGSHLGTSAVPNNNEAPMRPAASVSSLDSKYHKINPMLKQPAKNAKSFEAEDSDQSRGMDVEAIKREMEVMAQDKADLEAKVQELIRCHGELEKLRLEVTKLKEQRNEAEQGLLAKLGNVAHSPLSDTEKEELLLGASNSRLANSAPASIAPPEQLETPDWDKRSASSVSLSEVSVACLQDRIMQMEETHYSTNEELQATLQELADLQSQLTELQSDNERLGEEKGVLLESLCRQTEKLEDARSKMGTLQELLLENPNAGGGVTTEREQKLVELLKNGQEERETLMLKQEELLSEISELRRTSECCIEENNRLSERVRVLESSIDATHVERKQLDLELARAKEESSSRQIEISRLTTLLDNARAKIDEFEATRSKAGDKSELEELLDNVRKEKDVLEVQVASLQEQLSRSHCEVTKLKEQLSHLQEECKVTKNKARSALNDLEYECERGREERGRLSAELQTLQETTSELQVQCQCHLDDKRQLNELLTETQQHLGESERLFAQLSKELAEEKSLRAKENSEWEQFQKDLLLTVRVANDFKTEAQAEVEKILLENKQLRDKIRSLDTQIEQLNAQIEQRKMAEKPSSPQLRTTTESSAVLSTVTQEMSRRSKMSRQDSRLSVKSLIESIENATKQAKAGPGGSRSSSTSSLSSIASQPPATPTSPLREYDFKTALPLRDQQQLSAAKQQQKKINPDEPLKGNIAGIEEALPTPASILTSRGLEFSRRNSSNDLSERKDPLAALVKNGGSKRNALLKWCQNKTLGYRNIDITNFSSSWNDGLAFCALLHSYLPDRVPYDTLTQSEKRRNFSIAFAAAESVGIPTALNIADMIQQERPDWQKVMAYVTAIYKHFET